MKCNKKMEERKMTYLSNYKKLGVILLIAVLITGIFAMVGFAQNMGNAGCKNGFSKWNNSNAPRVGNGGYSQDAPDADGDGIPNGLDEDYIADCGCECCSEDDDGDGILNCQDPDYEGTCTCEGEPQGNQWGKQ